MKIDEKIMEEYLPITGEEKNILSNNCGVNKEDYTKNPEFIIDSEKLLEKGKLIEIRPHTRFVHFPKHKHNYIEMVYMCSGATTHIINDNRIVLNTGEILIMSQNSIQEILPAGENDIAINFVILPEFFTSNTKLIFSNESIIRNFIVGCLTNDNSFSEYLHFKVSNLLIIKNLVENVLWLSQNPQQGRRFLIENSVGLLFLQLMNFTERINNTNLADSFEKGIILKALKYIDEEYKSGSLTSLAKTQNQSISAMSRLIKQYTGKNFNELMQQKRLNQAVYYLNHTGFDIATIVDLVGYDNRSYFYRIFKKNYNMTPNEYRKNKQ